MFIDRNAGTRLPIGWSPVTMYLFHSGLCCQRLRWCQCYLFYEFYPSTADTSTTNSATNSASTGCAEIPVRMFHLSYFFSVVLVYLFSARVSGDGIANRSALSDARSSNQYTVCAGGHIITLPLNEALAALPAFAHGITRDQLFGYGFGLVEFRLKLLV
jgi:hypothetical protein